MTETERASERVLVLAPAGRDADLTCDVLGIDDIPCEPCADMAELTREIEAGAGAILISEEALVSEGMERLSSALENQETWSDLPILVATSASGSRAAHERIRLHLGRAGSLTILERPIPTTTLITALRSALSARRRQYQRRDLVAQLRTTIDELESEREMRDRFVAILAHDLRGPLATTKLLADYFARESVSADRRQRLAERMARNLEQMDRMLHDLLDIQRIQAGQGLPLDLERCDLGEVARAAADALNDMCGGRVVVHAEPNIEGIWSADQLHRALWNLGTNAIKYGAADSPIEIRVGMGEDLAWVSVHNEGPPIPPEEQKVLFHAFGRGHAARAGESRGWGLGLALVRACAEAHGGSVEVESEPDRGTTFTLRIPWDASAVQPSGGARRPERRDPSPAP